MKKRGVIIIIIGVLLILSPFYGLIRPKTCDTAGCFEVAAAECKKAEFLFNDGDKTITSYKIIGEEDDNCKLDIKIKEMISFSESTKKQFEGKKMTCLIPKEEFSRMKFEEMGGNLDYCSGPLKEAMYESIVKKLYNLVVKDMSAVLDEIEKGL